MSRPVRQARGRPLLVTDCDEVLLHMVSHFAEWLAEAHGIRFAFESGRFEDMFSDCATGSPVPGERGWQMLDLFFRDEMHRQTLVPGAAEALERIGARADIVILTNLGDEARQWRVDQLAGHGIAHQVVCNRGGKGAPVASLLAERRPSAAVFVDDLPVHHQSVAKHAPEVWRLHMIAEPRVAAAVAPAEHAHARIDDWDSACEWILERLEGKE